MPKTPDIEKTLRKYKVHVSKRKLSNYLKEIKRAEEPFPYEDELTLCAALLEKWEQDTEKKTVVLIPPAPKKKEFPLIYAFGVLSPDWPGLSDSCLGVVHEKGWNVHSLKGKVIDRSGKSLGIVLIAIEVNSPVELDRLKKERDGMALSLKRSSLGSLAKTFLLVHETRKIGRYGEVSEFIEKNWKGDELNSLIGPNGETVKFFASRSEAYIEERKVQDLADLIITNYSFLKRVRTSGGKAQVRVKNLKTSREHLTGVTVVGLDRDFSLNDCLEAIRYAVPNFKRKYNKEFTTSDGITSYRIEVTNEAEKPFRRDDVQRIRRSLLKMAERKRFERQRWIESIGGFEHYARAIIPFLLREYETSGKTQVYLSVGQSSEYFIEFKIIMVTSKTAPAEGRLALRCAEAIDRVRGLSVLSTKPPKVYGKEELDIIDLRADLDQFATAEEVYSAIKETLKHMIGEFRDFDEGMRRMDVRKLEEVRKRLKWKTDEDLLRQFYYRLEDFYRVGAPVEEITQLIQLGSQVLSRLEKEPDKVWVKAKNVAPEEGPPVSTIIAIAYSSERELFSNCLQTLNEYELTMNRVEGDKETVLICRLTQDGKPLSSQNLKAIVAKLKELDTIGKPC